MDSITPAPNAVKVKKWLTPSQSNDLRKAIYAKFPQLANNVQIVSTSGKVQMFGINGFQVDPGVADAVTCLIQDFGTTPASETEAAIGSTAATAAIFVEYQKRHTTKRQRSYRRKGGWL